MARMMETMRQPGLSLRTVFQILAAGACYYLATRTAWVLTFPDSKGPFDLPHTGDLAWRKTVGGAQGRARRRILCRAASDHGARISDAVPIGGIVDQPF